MDTQALYQAMARSLPLVRTFRLPARQDGRMTLDVALLRTAFPSLASGIAHFDGPGGTQTPLAVGQAILDTLTGPLSNRGTSVASERRSDDAVTAFRAACADASGRRSAQRQTPCQCPDVTGRESYGS